jgi:hypothetical protein
MSLKDLENAGVTLPPDQWGRQSVRSAVNRPGFLVCAAGAITGAVLMFVGEGRLITWLGALLFLVSFFLATATSLRAVASDGKSASTGRGT